MNYYNENDPKAAAWLRELIKAGVIAPGEVDERSIADVSPNDLSGFCQCHFFCGIAGWPLALQLAGWPGDRPVWTGSAPCQPLSCAGKRAGEKDERHLWPEFYRLISERHPATVFGEQVASPDGLEWLDGISLDLEELGYAVGAADLPAACVQSPHRRQRGFWVALSPGREEYATTAQGLHAQSGSCGADGGLGEPSQPGLEGHSGNGAGGSDPGRLNPEPDGPVAETGCDGGLVNTSRPACSRQRQQPDELHGTQGAWSAFDILHFRDGKTRRVEAGTFPLAHGIPGRVGLLRGYGNAIVPQVAAEFIRAYQQTLNQIEGDVR